MPNVQPSVISRPTPETQPGPGLPARWGYSAYAAACWQQRLARLNGLWDQLTTPRLPVLIACPSLAALWGRLATLASSHLLPLAAATALTATLLVSPSAARADEPFQPSVEFRINNFSNGVQSRPSVARDSDGDFVVVWQTANQDGSGFAVYRHRLNAGGAFFPGGPNLVNTFTTNDQSRPSVAMDTDGDFVVVWDSYGQDGGVTGVYGQRYNTAGVPQGSEFRANNHTTGNQDFAKVALDADGDFVVAWESYLQDGSGDGVYARRYNAAGVAQGNEFRVNTTTTSDQAKPSLALDAAGNFVVVWQSSGQDGSNAGIYGQRYTAAGVAQGSEFRVNTTTANGQIFPSVAMDSDGDFVVVWQSFEQDGSGYGVYVQRYNAAGAPQGAEFRANTYTSGSQRNPSVAMDADGDFVVVWQSFGQDGDEYGVYGQAFRASGAPLGSEFQVNTYTTEAQLLPQVAMDADGDFVVVWQSYGQDGSQEGVYARRYTAQSMSSVYIPLVLKN
ncbi:MAG: hypothetical protein Fur0044_15430 [Anaerolineae bacterium]